MPEIKAIETLYNGYRFRSRLEARWAIFFDVLGVEYEYEPEGFLLPSGNKYLPDFRIKCYGTRGGFGETCPFDLYIEVKGRMTQQDADKIHEFASCGYPILVIGNIPNPEEYYHGSEDLKSYDEMDGIRIYPWNYETIDGDYFAAFPAVNDGNFYLDGDDSNYQTMDPDIIRNAFKKARQARFEHGEKPTSITVSKNNFNYSHHYPWPAQFDIDEEGIENFLTDWMTTMTLKKIYSPKTEDN